MASSSTMAAEVSSQSTAVGESDSVVNTAACIYSPTNPESSLLIDVVGAKFKPTDEVLARHYLAGKMSGQTDGPIFPLIKEVDVYKCEPWLLSRDAHNFGDGNMYFFTFLKMKYQNGKNVNRVAGNGFWKITGNSSDVKGEDGMPRITKTPLAYYMNGQKSGESTKTQWLMKEFILEGQIAEKSKRLALCVIYLHSRKRKQCDQIDENVLLDDIVEGPSENLASDSYSDRRNLIMPATENLDSPGKRHRPSNSDFHIQDQGCFTPSDVIDRGHCHQPRHQISDLSTENHNSHQNQDCSNPKLNSSSNPSATHESLPADTIQPANGNQSLSNRAIEYQGATDTNINALNYQNPVSDFLDFDDDEFLNLHIEELRSIMNGSQLPPDVI
ncbi:NAC domain protein [Melia azedarach]|uniref:NAC domain protein n=1 Tax=Melia azedarach TaxID=155640 RepID=A0ACC1XDV2_MELAZ|nr:NAC domain protein [Melia azedarach]